MSELDKVEAYLRKCNFPYQRYECDKYFDFGEGFTGHLDRHQICVPTQDDCWWDAICQEGSYGYDVGLLEIYGELVDPKKDGDKVVGWLTADDVIERFDKWRSENAENIEERFQKILESKENVNDKIN